MRGWREDFHFAIQSSLHVAVKGMWKLCRMRGKSGVRALFRGNTEEIGSDFSHQGWTGKLVRAGGLVEISTSPQGLRLLLV